MSFGLGNVLGLAGDAGSLIATGGMDPMAWMDAVNQVSGGSSGSSGGMLGGLLGGDSSSQQNGEAQAASSILSSMGSSLIQDAMS